MIVKDWLKENKQIIEEERPVAVSVCYDYTVDTTPCFETNMSLDVLEKLFGSYALFGLSADRDMLWLMISRFYSKKQEEST